MISIARLYDADIGQGFLSVDPLAQEFGAISPYNYVLGNPVRLVDPDGRSADLPDPKRRRNERRAARRQERAERKWNRRIRSRLYSAFREGARNQSFIQGDQQSTTAYLQPIANELANRYGGKKWFSFYSEGSYAGLGNPASSTNPNGVNVNQARHDASIVLFSTSGPAQHFRDEGSPQATNTSALQDGGSVIYNAPDGLSADQVASGGFTFSFDGMANPDRLQISGESGNVIVDQIVGSLEGESTTSGVIPMRTAGTSITATISHTGSQANAALTQWDLSLGFFYLNPQPRVYSGQHTTPR